MNNSHRGHRRLILGTAAIAALHCATPGESSPPTAKTFHLVPQKLGNALRAVGRESGREIMFSSEAVVGKESPALDGTMTADQAVAKLLEGSGLAVDYREDVILIRGRSDITEGAIEGEPRPDIVVTGSRIRGAPIASPIVVMTQAQIEETGKTTLGDAVRTLPQNFGGGQNPGIVGNGSQGNNANFNSSSSLNLRGLGPDATLTLINGHRIAYDANVQGVDIDSIPLAALDRIEIVPDGASALYGSDAVGGVANIILKKDYEGATVSARYGASTDGGGEQQQYTGVTGSRWAGGGAIATFDYTHDSPITGADRSYTRYLGPYFTLVPVIAHYGGIVSAHQSLDAVRFDIDGLYSHRTSTIFNTFYPPASYNVDGNSIASRENTFAISPRVSISLSTSWQAYITGTYSRDRSSAYAEFFSDSSRYLAETVRYYNSTRNVEAGLDGPLFPLFSQMVRLAAGGGYRSNGLRVGISGDSFAPTDLFQRQSSYYAFGELSVPIVEPSMAVPGISRLSASAAVRYEDYPGQAQLATPKFGIIYAPTPGVELKATWGQSFKTPTLDQLLEPKGGTLVPASYFGPSSFPTTATAIFLSGGNPDLKPERATSWTITGKLAPAVLPNFELVLSYFHTRYSQRVIEPFSSFSGAYEQPNYQYLIQYHPSSSYLQQLLGTIPGGIANYTDAPYDPTSVVAVIDDRQHNAAKQIIQGLDADLSYKIALSSGRSIIASGSASYMKSRQQLGPGQDFLPLAGQIFHIPNWNARAGLVYTSTTLSLSANATYIGSVRDQRLAPSARVASMTPIDLTAVYRVRSSFKPLDKLDITFTLQNIFNDKPGPIRTTAPNDAPFDSSNYSTLGRFISITVAKSF